MKRLGWVGILLAALALAQFANPPAPGGAMPPLPQPAPGGGPLPLPAPAKRYPLPDWVRPGIAFLYQELGGQLTQVYLVTDVVGDEAYGLGITLMSLPGATPMVDVKALPLVQGGVGFFYAHPQAVADYLQSARQAPQQGVQVSGGNGIFAVLVQNQNSTLRYALRYDPKTGLVQEIAVSTNFQGQQGRGGTAANYRYAGYETFAWQSPADFPPAAREPHVYEILTAVPGYGGSPGMTNPLGQVEVRALRLSKPLALFQLQANLQGYPQSDTAGGLTALGPHYFHPELIRRGTVFALSKLGLRYTVQGDTATLAWGQVPLSVLRVHPQTGLILERRESVPLGQIVYRLVR